MPVLQPTADHPIPFDISDEQPATHQDAIAVAVNTVDAIESLGGSIDYSDEDLEKAQSLVLGEDKPKTPKSFTSSAEAKAVTALVRKFNFNSFGDALEARNYITNKSTLFTFT